jgi:hypothetical protein
VDAHWARNRRALARNGVNDQKVTPSRDCASGRARGAPGARQLIPIRLHLASAFEIKTCAKNSEELRRNFDHLTTTSFDKNRLIYFLATEGVPHRNPEEDQ